MLAQTDSLYKQSYLSRLPEMGKLAPETFRAFNEMTKRALAPGALSVKLKELIAVAVSHVTGCPYCIAVHVENLKKEEATKEEMAEAIMVAAALKAGMVTGHGTNALNAFDGKGEDELYKASNVTRISEFSKLAPEVFKGLMDFGPKTVAPGALSTKDKELIAVAIAHTTGCAYCIDAHTKAAKQAGASREEIAESIFTAATLSAGAVVAHSVNALNAYDE